MRLRILKLALVLCVICIALSVVVVWLKPHDHLSKLQRYASSERVRFLGTSSSRTGHYRLRILTIHDVFPSEAKTILANEYRKADGWSYVLNTSPTFTATRGQDLVFMGPSNATSIQRAGFGDLEIVEVLMLDKRAEWWERATHGGKLKDR